MEISPQDIQNNDTFKDFVKDREIRESTEVLYARRLTDFCNLIKKDPTELMDEIRKEDYQKSRNEKVSDYVGDYLNKLKNEGKSANTIKNRFDTLNAFFSDFDIDKSIIKNIKPDENLTLNELPQRDQIRKAVQICGIRDRAIILLHFSSGMGAIELRYLTYGDFIDAVDEYLDFNNQEKLDILKVVSELEKQESLIGTWQIKKIKSGIPYITFNSSESSVAILDYLMDRERSNKPITSFDDALFVNTWNKPLQKSVHGAIFKRINDKAGFEHLEGKRRFLTSGTLRNAFEKNLYKAGMDKLIIDSMLGFKINNMQESNLNDIGYLKDQYMNTLEFLQVENIDSDENSEYNELLAKFNRNDQELKQIKEHLKYLEEKMKFLAPDERQS